MKLLIVAACIFVVANGQLDKFRVTVRQFLEECKEIVGARDVDVDQILHQITPESDAGKCVIACVNKKFKIQNADGKFNPDARTELAKAMEGFDDKLCNASLDINEKCMKEDLNLPDECEIGARWFTCMSKGAFDAGLPLILTEE